MEKRIFIAVLLLFSVAFGFAQENGYRSVVITPVNPVIQPGESVTLNATGATFFQWSPATGLSTTIGPTTVASPSVTTTYTCTGFEPGPERVTNGDFEQGNTGFTSSYQYNSDLYGEGTYYVDSDASWHHESFTGHGHGGSGNFMIINGATMPGTNVWTETVSVQPNTYYAFSTYVCTVCVGAEAQLQFSINGQQIGNVFSAPVSTNTWIQFYQIWNSGNSTSATITILNQNTTGGGNDFGLDDISFCQLVYDSEAHCTVTVDAMSAGNDNVSTCYEEPVVVDFLDNDHILQSCNNLSCSVIQQPAHGSATYTNSIMRYTPNNGYSGTDSFRYRITCSGQSAEATVNVTVYGQQLKEETAVACGEFYWHGNTYTETGDYQVTVPDVGLHGCDSVCILHLTIEEIVFSDTIASVCETFFWHGIECQNTGNYVDTIQTELGCDSIITLHLTMGSVSEYFDAPKVCYSYDWEVEGETYHYEQSCHDTITVEGQGDECDRIYYLDLTIYQASQTTIDTLGCNEFQSPWCDSVYTQSGIYSHYYVGPHGCDSLVRLNLTIVQSEVFDEEDSTCELPYHWQSHGYDLGYVYEQGFHSQDVAVGDCFVTFNLNLMAGSDSEPNVFNVEDCNSHEWQDSVYYESGTYEIHRLNAQGCDSTLILNLTLNYAPDVTGIKSASNEISHWVIPATEFQINEYTYYIECSNEDAVDRVEWSFVNPIDWMLNPSEDGMSCGVLVSHYITDTVLLQAKVYNECAPDGLESRYWLVCSFFGVDDAETMSVLLYPNPAHEQLSVEADGIRQVSVYNMFGQICQKHTDLSTDKLILDTAMLPSALYYVEVVSKWGRTVRKVEVMR